MGVVAVRTKQEQTDSAEEPRCFAGNLAWLLYRAHWSLAAELTAALAPVGVSARGYHILRAALSGEHTQTELAEMIGLDKTTMVVAVDELEKAGLAERRPSPKDRRARIISVTAAGRRKVGEADEVKERVQADVLGDLSEREGKALIDALGKLVEGRLADCPGCTPPLRRRSPRAA